MPHAVIIALQKQQAHLTSAVDSWARMLRENAQKTSASAAAQTPLVLPALRGLHPFNLQEVASAFPGVFGRLAVDSDKEKVEQHLARITMSASGVHAPLVCRLSEIACEAASDRVLLMPQDSLDVTSFSVLTSAAFTNLCWLLSEMRQKPALKIGAREEAMVLAPLTWARRLTEKLRPGDLWVVDLLARSAVYLQSRSEYQKVPFVKKVAGQLIGLSLLNKLLEVTRFGPDLEQDADHQSWPGLAIMLCDKGAGSLRTAIVGTLAAAIQKDTTGRVAAAFFHFLTAILRLREPRQTVAAQRLVGHLLCELLALDVEILARLRSDPKASRPLLDAIVWLEQGARSGPPAEGKDDHVSVTIARDCLRTYESYQNLADLLLAQRSAEPA